MTAPRATVRLQLHRDFTLDDARAQVGYYAGLGISHYYVSPIFTARPGSTHGYDVIDFTQVNPELGGEPALLRLVDTLRLHGMGLVIDIVPNHMGVGAGMGGGGNAWWLDVLERGQASAHANAFDIDWTAPGLSAKLLLPILGQPYGETLEAGELQVRFDSERQRFALQYLETWLPLTPECAAALLTEAGGVTDVDIDTMPQITEVLARYDPATPAGLQKLHALLERQHYRLAWWRTAADAINWRRFFEITDLAGLRMERPAVFEAVHALTFRLYREGLIDGVRVDHVDGLADPAAYCRALHDRLHALHGERPAHLQGGKPWIVLEKILAADEHLRTDWPVDGTTGYDFMTDASGVLHDPAGETALTALWNVAVLRTDNFASVAIAARRQILAQNLDSEFNALVRRLTLLAQSSWQTRDITAPLIQRALEALLDHIPVYRTYMTGAGDRGPEDEALMRHALAAARQTLRAADHVALDHLNEWLGCRRLAPDTADEQQPVAGGQRPLAAAELEAMQTATIVKFQQLTSPLAAKAVEDTAFYRYGRLLSLNEVGGDPGRFGLTVDAFHARMQHARDHHPHRLLATATHDHKRGEDSRARLAVLSERASEWAAAVLRWRTAAASLRLHVDGHLAPTAADELMLYQALVGAWPLTLEADDADGVAALCDRLVQWQEKALREAKLCTSWVAPNADYENACHAYLRGLANVPLVEDDADAGSVLHGVAAFVRELGPPTAVNGLTQTLLRLTVPGVPDLYQGTDWWDFSLVDPDNRRPVDYVARAAGLAADGHGAAPATLLRHWRDGHVKQALIRRALALRGQHPLLFADGSYTPLAAHGPRADQVIAFVRRLGEQTLLVVCTRQSAAWIEGDLPLLPVDAWADTSITLPSDLPHLGDWHDVLTQRSLAGAQTLRVAELLSVWPVALLDNGPQPEAEMTVSAAVAEQDLVGTETEQPPDAIGTVAA